MQERPGLVRASVVHRVFLIPSLGLLALVGFDVLASFDLGQPALDVLAVAGALVHGALEVFFVRLALQTYRGHLSDNPFFGYAVGAVLILLFGDTFLAAPLYYLVGGG